MWILPIPSTLTKEMRYCFGTFEASPESLQIRDEQRWYIKAAAYCTFLPLCHCLFWFAGVTDGSCSRFNSSLFCFCLNFSKINGRVNGWCRCRFTIRRCNFGRCSGDGFPLYSFFCLRLHSDWLCHDACIRRLWFVRLGFGRLCWRALVIVACHLNAPDTAK